MDVSHFKKEKTRKNRRGVWKWKLKISVTWNAIKKAILGTLKPQHFRLSCAPSTKQVSNVDHVHQDHLTIKPHRQANTRKKASSDPTKSLARLLLVPYTASDFIDYGDHMTPTKSPKENISAMWQVARASCRYNRHKLFQELGLVDQGYEVTKYIYSMSHVDVPKWFERSRLGCTWSKDSNWMGFVAVSNNKESQRIGRRDVVVSWRGTVAPTEWLTDLKAKLERFGSKNVKVQHGFLSIYKSKDKSTRYNKSSASEQVMQELDRLVNFFRGRGEMVSLTLTGHSLGGALALLNAYEAEISFSDVFINVISFGAPRVGNLAFKEKLNELGVKTLRVVNKQDIVPKLPGILFNEILHKFNPIMQRLNCVYRHVGTQLKLDKCRSPYLKDDTDFSGCHNLELYLGKNCGATVVPCHSCTQPLDLNRPHPSKKAKFRRNARRGLALVNKSSDMLIEELKIPEFWYQLPYKGLVLNKCGRRVKPGREPEDIPSPFSSELSSHFATSMST
ncbi:Lipase 3 domain-containing protein [Citrus sinensis]|uniref:Lipase 3 domain-containing protein n=1 Tax=Citrus sinensis TaxID=2711 RepID=A0ACB8NEL0_CITSI|nr:Lipase 3 domain-containing protein [Citrus sinensis]